MESSRDIERSCANVTMIGAERPEAKVEVILGVDTHLDFHVAWPWIVLADAWAS